jgi:hypothetical protein
MNKASRVTHNGKRQRLEKKETCVTLIALIKNTRWFKYDRDDLCVNKSQFVPVRTNCRSVLCPEAGTEGLIEVSLE